MNATKKNEALVQYQTQLRAAQSPLRDALRQIEVNLEHARREEIRWADAHDAVLATRRVPGLVLPRDHVAQGDAVHSLAGDVAARVERAAPGVLLADPRFMPLKQCEVQPTIPLRCLISRRVRKPSKQERTELPAF